MSKHSKKKKNKKAKSHTNFAGLVNVADMHVLQNASLKETLTAMTPETLFVDRELSWLEFNRRVLNEAADEGNPLLERVKFLAIFDTNLDEFIMIRVSGILAKVLSHTEEPVLGGLTAKEELEAMQTLMYPMQNRQITLWEEMKPQLAEQHIHFASYAECEASVRDALDSYFEEEVFPLLTPLMVDPTHPFPFVSNLSLNLAVTLGSGGRSFDGGDEVENHFARIKIPPNLKRYVEVGKVFGKYSNGNDTPAALKRSPSADIGKPQRPDRIYVLLEEVIQGNLNKLFPGMNVLETHLFRVIRDADFEIAEDEAGDLLRTMEQATYDRKFGNVVQLVVKPDMPPFLVSMLSKAFNIKEKYQLLKMPFFGFKDLWQIYGTPGVPELKYTGFVGRTPNELKSADLWKVLQETDLMLNHPYDSFSTTTEFFSFAAKDPRVLAIKATLYRVGENSPIVKSLLDAVRNEKEVTVLVELKARFDEKNNIVWARQLEAEGVHVIYGVKGLKTHAKLGLVIRREGGKLRQYTHMSTGNYNNITSKFYTDMALLTARRDIGADMLTLFNRLTGLAPAATYSQLAVAPEFLRSKLYAMIDQEIQNKRDGKEASIYMKCNSLTDGQMIVKLYEASHEGVNVRLLIRGICCLRPGVPNVSDNIEVHSIVGRFLEHSRIYWFHNDGEPKCFMSSADLMVRNLDRRVENCFPILQKNHRDWIWEYVLESQWKDTAKTSILERDGTWTKLSPSKKERYDHQEDSIFQLAIKKSDWRKARIEQQKAYEAASNVELEDLLAAAAERGNSSVIASPAKTKEISGKK